MENLELIIFGILWFILGTIFGTIVTHILRRRV